MSRSSIRAHLPIRRLRFEPLESRLPLSANPVAPTAPAATTAPTTATVEQSEPLTFQGPEPTGLLELRLEVVDAESQVVSDFEPGQDYVLRVHNTTDIITDESDVQHLFMEVGVSDTVELQSRDGLRFFDAEEFSTSVDLQSKFLTLDVDSQAFANTGLLAEIPFTTTAGGGDVVFDMTPLFMMGRQNPDMWFSGVGPDGQTATALSLSGASPVSSQPESNVDTNIQTQSDAVEPLPEYSPPAAVDETVLLASLQRSASADATAVSFAYAVSPAELNWSSADPVSPAADTPETANLLARPQLWDLNEVVDGFLSDYEDSFKEEREFDEEGEKTLELLLLESDPSVATEPETQTIRSSWRAPSRFSLSLGPTEDKDEEVESEQTEFVELGFDWEQFRKDGLDYFEPKRSEFRMQARIISTATEPVNRRAVARRDDYVAIDIAPLLHLSDPGPSRPATAVRQDVFVDNEHNWERDLQAEQHFAIIGEQTQQVQALDTEQSTDSQSPPTPPSEAPTEES